MGGDGERLKGSFCLFCKAEMKMVVTMLVMAMRMMAEE